VRADALNPEAEVQRRLREIRERIEAGTVEFADMARQYSADGSASQGRRSRLGLPGRHRAGVRARDGRARARPDRRARAHTRSGHHLIQVTERRTDEASPERLRAAARAAIRERKAAEAYQEFLSQVRSRAYVVYRLDER
jgi:peptidyl-prolyl cis-trans isomerase SurA